MKDPLSTDLVACPFCGNDGSNSSYALAPKELEPAFVYVHCERCGAQGPCEGDKVHAITEWNKRCLTLAHLENI